MSAKRTMWPTGRPSASVNGATATFSTFLIIALVAAWSVFYAPGPAAREGESTIISLPSGAGVSAIAATLKSAGVIRSTDMFKAAASLTGADRKLRAGEYEVPSGASLRTVLSLLVDGRVVRHFVTLPEVWSSAQAVDILMKEELGRRWLEPDLFRIGASSMLADIARQLEHHVTGRYAATSHQPLA